ncbi:phytoene dehydrogenase [Aliishimia ponticola]|uniref:Phytoene dehydrogenase n=1 Tax=Aliishimia ponticola TaxID=2499833 RepID=A0A4S4NLI2_9RHOB|nr:FAD-dependent oxidoreductase [Aliishimia ponticola]THH37030.1 phytoene dehydrogenase [Aliishimia ponticola]
MATKVAVLGGGIGGLTAGHELASRGFDVEIFDAKKIPGGKARSIPVPDSGTQGRRDLPGEHGFRFFPAFYVHLPDSMSRIPFGPHGATCADNLIGVEAIEIARYDAPPIDLLARVPRSILDLKILIKEIYSHFLPLPMSDLEFFAERLWQVMTSCEERRYAELEPQSWWDFVDAENRSPEYQKFLAEGLSRSLVAARAQEGSARTVGQIQVRLADGMIRGGKGTDRVLNAPTTDALIHPWIAEITRLGGTYHSQSVITAITMEGDRVKSVTVQTPQGSSAIEADYFVCAIPIEHLDPLIDTGLLSAAPELQGVKDLAQNVRWMNGIQFFLTEDVKIVDGHTLYVDSPWAITSISEAQLWKHLDLSQYGDGKVRGILSVDISDWNTPGTFDPKKKAKDLDLQQIADEVWQELKRSQNVDGKEILRDDMIHSWFIDTDIEMSHSARPHPVANLEPLFINTPGSWKQRPKALTSIANFSLASDYVQTQTDLACMEAANEAARVAVNGILDATGWTGQKCRLWSMPMPDALRLWREHDKHRFEQGKPWDGRLIF